MIPNEGQEEDKVAIEWTPLSYSKTELRIQMDFKNPGEISQGVDKNRAEFIVWNSALFIRESDKFNVLGGDKSAITHDIPKLDGNPGLTQAVIEFAQGMSATGQGLMIFGAIFSFISSGVINLLLASVRSLGIVTHCLMM